MKKKKVRRARRNPEILNFRAYSRTAKLNPPRRKKVKKFSLAQMRAGILVELEHTKRLPKSRRLAAATRIAKDHLRETPNYYTRHRKCFPEEYRKKHNPSERLKKDSEGREYVPQHPYWEHNRWLRKIAKRLATGMRISGGSREQAMADALSDYHFEHPVESLLKIKAMLPQGPLPLDKEALGRKFDEYGMHGLRNLNPKRRKTCKCRRNPCVCGNPRVTRVLPGGMRSFNLNKRRNPFKTKKWEHVDLLKNWRRKIDPRSIRTKTIHAKSGGKRLLRVGCPKGQWIPTVERCKASLKAVSMLRPVKRNPMTGRISGPLINVVRGHR